MILHRDHYVPFSFKDPCSFSKKTKQVAAYVIIQKLFCPIKPDDHVFKDACSNREYCQMLEQTLR